MTIRNRSSKIQPQHLDRQAFVYIRQSSLQQVQQHQVSTQLQYILVYFARDLGWPEDRVQVIDEDLGKSAAGMAERQGFQRLVTEVTLDHVGLILGIEMSRLARSSRDWHQEVIPLDGNFLPLKKIYRVGCKNLSIPTPATPGTARSNLQPK